MGMKKRMKKAFTLSEVLITLVIIGVIAAITVPTIVAAHQKEELRTAFMKTYSDLNNFSKKFYFDKAESFTEYSYINGARKASQEFMNYFNMTTATASNDRWDTPTEERDRAYKLKRFDGGPVYSNFCDETGYHSDISGRLYRFNDSPTWGDENVNGPVICVDINGQKGPNRMGKDYFFFIFTIDGRAIPMGMDDEHNTPIAASSSGRNFFNKGPEYCKRKPSSDAENLSCAYYALANKHPNNPNKKYWEDFL